MIHCIIVTLTSVETHVFRVAEYLREFSATSLFRIVVP